MKRIVYCLVLVTSINGSLFAQNNSSVSNTDKTFELKSQNIRRRFFIDLGKGNKMQVELTNLYTGSLPNVDSLLQLFMRDIDPLKDSLQDELTTKRIDYVADPSERKKIRLQQFKPKGSSFVVDRGELASLKLEQDTVNLIGTYVPEKKNKFLKPGYNYRISIFINRLSELPLLAGKLDDKIKSLRKNEGAKWKSDKNDIWHAVKDNSISATQPAGNLGGAGDYLLSFMSVNLQNYKNYFVPSFSLGLMASMRDLLKCEVGLYWEPQFLFQNNLGKLQTYRNDFLTLVVGQRFLRSGEPGHPPSYFTNISLGYLIRRQGEFYDKNTLRLGFGSKSFLGGKASIEPMLYFHDLFQNTTPGLRLSLHF